jgi:histone acetyltransferase (RNA polymerase elongator complex component)
MRHANISIFVPHIGCPQNCAFCDQRAISGKSKEPDETDIDFAVAAAKSSSRYDSKNTEIAFFGGSFTAIEKDYMISLLSAAKKYVDNGDVFGIRVSTRPDFINSEILSILKHFGVTTIELGAQSLDDDVLKANNRGHKASDVIAASELIKSFSFSLGLQMMTGLYGDSNEKSIDTAKKIIALSPDFVRIYPTIVLKNTELAKKVASGQYAPQTVDEAVSLGAKLIVMFNEVQIPIIRFGLHTINEENYVAGPWHPSLAELAQSRVYFNAAKEMFKGVPKGEYLLKVGRGETSKMIGQKRENIVKLTKMGYKCKVAENEEIKPYKIKIEDVK